MKKLTKIALAVATVATMASAQEHPKLDLPEEVNSKHSRICGDFHWKNGKGYNPNDNRPRCETIQRRIWLYNARIRNALELENVSEARDALRQIDLMLEKEEQVPAYNIGERTLTRFKSEFRQDIGDAHGILDDRIRDEIYKQGLEDAKTQDHLYNREINVDTIKELLDNENQAEKTCE